MPMQATHLARSTNHCHLKHTRTLSELSQCTTRACIGRVCQRALLGQCLPGPTHSPAPAPRHNVPRLQVTATVVYCYKASAASAPTARGSALASALAIPECTHRSCPPSALITRSAAYSCCCRARALSSCSMLARARGGSGMRAAPSSAPFWLAGVAGVFADAITATRSTQKCSVSRRRQVGGSAPALGSQ